MGFTRIFGREWFAGVPLAVMATAAAGFHLASTQKRKPDRADRAALVTECLGALAAAMVAPHSLKRNTAIAGSCWNSWTSRTSSGDTRRLQAVCRRERPQAAFSGQANARNLSKTWRA